MVLFITRHEGVSAGERLNLMLNLKRAPGALHPW
jgi:hypothetical protein